MGEFSYYHKKWQFEISTQTVFFKRIKVLVDNGNNLHNGMHIVVNDFNPSQLQTLHFAFLTHVLLGLSFGTLQQFPDISLLLT